MPYTISLMSQVMSFVGNRGHAKPSDMVNSVKRVTRSELQTLFARELLSARPLGGQ